MTEQYEQITDWNGWMAAYSEGTLCQGTAPLGDELNLRRDNFSGVQANLNTGLYYRKVVPQEVELFEYQRYNKRRLPEDIPPPSYFTSKEVKLLNEEDWRSTGYIIKGVRVKA